MRAYARNPTKALDARCGFEQGLLWLTGSPSIHFIDIRRQGLGQRCVDEVPFVGGRSPTKNCRCCARFRLCRCQLKVLVVVTALSELHEVMTFSCWRLSASKKIQAICGKSASAVVRVRRVSLRTGD
jgi:hypothetical protein